ncbi:Uncharacterised protein [Vibrio cholerae]|nr:Uncharacterised protein [Vibrio cholerae]
MYLAHHTGICLNACLPHLLEVGYYTDLTQ